MLSKGKQNARDKKRTIKSFQERHREVADFCYHGNCTCLTFTIAILLRKRQDERDLQVTSLHLNRHETKESCLCQKKFNLVLGGICPSFHDNVPFCVFSNVKSA